ncbi:MAG: hypothetical protein QME75_12540 [Deltaproteobacteria bacterium]|nr:hypothetical protein [Deltaproteobacteria bacterium]
MPEKYLRFVMWFGLAGMLLGLISQLNRIDLDLFHELALIRELINTGSFPLTDVFSYVPTKNPVVHHEWGTGAIVYLITIHQGLGAPGLLLLKYLLTAFICIGGYIFTKRQGASDYAFSFFAFWAISLGWIGFTTIRAQLFSLMFLVIFLFLIEENRKGKNWPLFVWLPFYVAWVNIHGGFLIGLGLFLIYIVELFLGNFLQEKKFIDSLNHIKFQIIIFGLMCFAIIINPYGTSYLPYIWQAVTLDRTQFISEWRPVWQINITTFIGLSLSIILLAFVICYQEKRSLIVPGTLMVLGAAWLSFRHYRHLSIYSVILMCYAPILLENSSLSPVLKNLLQRHKKILCFSFIIVAIFGISLASWNKFWQLRIPTAVEEHKKGVPIYPASAVKFLKEKDFTGNMTVHFNYGAYVSWNLYPQVKVSMDSRFEVAYSVEQVVENLNFYAAKEGWQETIKRYPTDAILVPNWKPIEKELSQDDIQKLINFRKVYVDDAYTIYMRADLAEKFPFLDNRGKTIVGTFP